MSYVITFDDSQPSAREDGLPWTHVRIDEAAASDGPWTIIETQALSPVDTDPERPQARDITTALATLENGWYRLAFLDAIGNLEVTQPVQRSTAMIPLWAPPVADVGALLHARTYVDSLERGTFDTDTRPTGAQVQKLLDFADGDLLSKIGIAIPERFWPEARRLAAIQAASLVESSYFPNEIDTDRSAYRQYAAMYLAGVDKLYERVHSPAALRLA